MEVEAETLVRWRVTSPREAALRILAPRFQRTASCPTTIPLADFQRDSVERAQAILEQRNGVLIADSVGLGKTFVALALIERALARDHKVLLVVPASLRRMWRKELTRLNLSTGDSPALVSHTQLALGTVSNSKSQSPSQSPTHRNDLIVVDEAHAFRNPLTRRYRALRTACRGGRVVLLTATPVNNSLSDLYFLLRLFCSDGALRDLGIGSLRATLQAAVRPSDLVRLKQALMVRTTRAEVRAHGGAQEAGVRREASAAPTFRFPREARTHTLSYEMPLSVDELREYLSSLTFAAHRADSAARFALDVMRFGLLKRMESSTHALRATLQRQIRFSEEFVAVLRGGLLLRPRTFRSSYDVADNTVQLILEPVLLEAAPATDAPRLLKTVERELHTLRAWHGALSRVRDDKLKQLLSLLHTRHPCKTVVFTEFRDTARYLWECLRWRFAVGLIDGAGAWIGDSQASRRQVVACFAPLANGIAQIHEREAIEVLIATDVLAEGMNLQDADAVVSYDLPWNPVRLIQRAGRVDRIGSRYDVVHVYNFLPDREFDALLGLARTLRNKLAAMRGSVGLERAVLEPGEDFESAIRGLAAGDASILDRIEGGLDAALRTEFERAAPVPADPVSVPIAALDEATGRELLVGLERGTEWAVARFDALTFTELGGADQTLASALGEQNVTSVDVTAVTAVAERFRSDWQRRNAVTEVRSTSAAGRLARLVTQHLSELPLDAPATIYAEADEVLDQLSVVQEAAMEDELLAVATKRIESLGELLPAIRKALSQQRKNARDNCEWQLTGAIVVD